MSRGEKTDFLLEQVRLCIAAKDWLTAENMGRKISTRWFDSKDGDDSTAAADDDTPKYNKIDLKLRYESPPKIRILTAQVLRFDGSVVVTSR
jgi:hypothetical protein